MYTMHLCYSFNTHIHSHGLATHVSPHLSMVSLTVSDIGCELEYFYFSSLWPESTQIGPINSLIVYAHERRSRRLYFRKIADYSELPELRNFRIG